MCLNLSGLHVHTPIDPSRAFAGICATEVLEQVQKDTVKGYLVNIVDNNKISGTD